MCFTLGKHFVPHKVIVWYPCPINRLAGISSIYRGPLMPYKTPSHHRKSAYAAQHGLCCYCRKPMWLNSVKEFAQANQLSLKQAMLFKCTAEHLHARSESGNDSSTNIAAACWFCNSRRHRRRIPLKPDSYLEFVKKKLSAGGWNNFRSSASG